MADPKKAKTPESKKASAFINFFIKKMINALKSEKKKS